MSSLSDASASARSRCARYQSTTAGKPSRERQLRREAQRAKLADVGTAPARFAGRRRLLRERRLAAELLEDQPAPARAIGHLLGIADVVDVEVLALFDHADEAVGEVVDVDEGARLPPVALDRETDGAGPRVGVDGRRGAHRELRDDVLEAHVRAVDIVRAEHDDAIESGRVRS